MTVETPCLQGETLERFQETLGGAFPNPLQSVSLHDQQPLETACTQGKHSVSLSVSKRFLPSRSAPHRVFPPPPLKGGGGNAGVLGGTNQHKETLRQREEPMTTTDTTTEHGIEITVKVLATGDTETTVIHPGQHALICVEPAYRSAVQIYQNGTTQITIRHRGTTPVTMHRRDGAA